MACDSTRARACGTCPAAAASSGPRYARALSNDDSATLADHREAVETIDSVAKLWKQVFGESHPETPKVQSALQKARKKLAWAHASRDATDSYTRSLGSVLLAKGMTSLELSELKDSVGL